MPIDAAGDPDWIATSRALTRTLAADYFAVLLAQACIVPLQDPDERRHAPISWEMLQSGDWITPHLNGIRYYEKPRF